MDKMVMLVSLLAGVSVGAAWYGAYRWRQSRWSLAERIQTGRLEPGDFEEVELSERFGKRVLKPLLRRALTRLGRLTPGGNVERLQHNLILAGNPGDLSVLDFLGAKLVSAVLVGAATFVVLMYFDVSGLPALLFWLAGCMLGLYAPNLWLRRRKNGRQKVIRRALPDALDMMSICVDAGLGFEAALMKVAERWKNELTEEFSRVVKEVRMGVRRADALRRMVDRTGVPEVSSFVAVLVQADRLGVGITNVLHTQSDEARRKRRQRAEEQARKAPVKMLVPLVLFIFPAMFVVILGPAVPRFMAMFQLIGG